MTTSADNASLKIMVIDDSSTIRRSAEIFLGQAGYQVVLADDGRALRRVVEHGAQLLLHHRAFLLDDQHLFVDER